MRSFELIPTRSSVPRMWGVLEVVAGVAAVVGALLGGAGARGASVAEWTGAALALLGAVACVIPWRRIPARATLILPAAAAVFFGLQFAYGGDQGFRIGIALWLAGITGEIIAWRAELRRRDELTLHAERREDLVRSMVQTATDATLVIKSGGAITFASPSVTTTLGYDAAELLETTIHALVSPEDAATILAVRSTAGPRPGNRIDCQVLHHDGRWLRAEVSVTGLPDEDGLVLTIHDVTRWKELEEQLTRQAFHDPLTGLANRALYVDRLEHALGRRRHHTKGAAVLFLDLDDFKTVNDTLGHVEGDHLIRLVAARLTETLRPEDTAARLGGDEFALLLEDVDEDQAAAIATRVLAALDRPFDLSERPMRIGPRSASP